MRSAFLRAGVVLVTAGTFAAVVTGTSAQAAPPFTPDAVAEALTFSAVPDVTGTVPVGACEARFIVRGGSGAGFSLASTSAPGQVTGSLTVSAGQTYRLGAGTSANGSSGGLGGNGNGGNGYTVGGYVGYGGGAGSVFQLGNSLAAVAGGGGGAGNSWQGDAAGGGGGAGVGGAGGNGQAASPYQALGGPVAMTGMASGGAGLQTAGGSANLHGGAGGGGGYAGGEGSTEGLSAGGGSNYANTSLPGMNITMNSVYPAAASGYSGIAFFACPNPSAITSVTVAPNGTSASLSFPAAVDNGTPVTGYQYSLNGGTSWNTLTTSGTSTKTATISALTLSTAYTVDVRPVFTTANIESNDVAAGGPGKAVTAYVTATSQSFTTLAQNVSPAPSAADSSLASTSAPQGGLALTGAVLFIASGLALVGLGRRKLRP